MATSCGASPFSAHTPLGLPFLFFVFFFLFFFVFLFLFLFFFVFLFLFLFFFVFALKSHQFNNFQGLQQEFATEKHQSCLRCRPPVLFSSLLFSSFRAECKPRLSFEARNSSSDLHDQKSKASSLTSGFSSFTDLES